MTGAVYKRAVQLMEAELGDEIVALDSRRGLCFGLNSVAADVWRLLEQPRTAPELCGALLASYDVTAETCRDDVEALLKNMVQEGLVAKASAGKANPKEARQGNAIQ